MPELQAMTINKVIYGVTRNISEHFPEARMFVEEAPQELNPPAFFVKLLNPSQDQELGIRYWRYHPFDIHYFDPNHSNMAMNEVAEELYDILRYIEIDGNLYRGISMNHEIVDRVLHFFVDYNFRVKEYVEPIPDMEELNVEEGLKE